MNQKKKFDFVTRDDDDDDNRGFQSYMQSLIFGLKIDSIMMIIIIIFFSKFFKMENHKKKLWKKMNKNKIAFQKTYSPITFMKSWFF